MKKYGFLIHALLLLAVLSLGACGGRADEPAESAVRDVGRLEAPAEEAFAEYRADAGVFISVPEAWTLFVASDGDVSFDAGDVYFEIKRVEKSGRSPEEAVREVLARWSEDCEVRDSRTEAAGGREAWVAEIRQQYTEQVAYAYHTAAVDAADRYYVLVYQVRGEHFERYDAVFARILGSVRFEELPEAGEMREAEEDPESGELPESGDVLALEVPEEGAETFSGERGLPGRGAFSLEDVPEYAGEAAYEVPGGPYFTDAEVTDRTFLSFPALDALGRCGAAVGCLGPELAPGEARGSIGAVKPSGWHTVKYDGIEGNYLYNRCHLIGYQLCGENANERNLITGTRYLNVQGMEPYERMTADYIAASGNHVMYRATPVFAGDDLVARGVLLEAASVEEDDFSFCVFCYNVQPGVVIDYATGESEGKEFTGNE